MGGRRAKCRVRLLLKKKKKHRAQPTCRRQRSRSNTQKRIHLHQLRLELPSPRFLKQKTAYEIYQCDWSSDVCSSDLPALRIADSRTQIGFVTGAWTEGA